MKIIKKKVNNKRLCEICNKLFNENDLDMYNGKFICRKCEDEEVRLND